MKKALIMLLICLSISLYAVDGYKIGKSGGILPIDAENISLLSEDVTIDVNQIYLGSYYLINYNINLQLQNELNSQNEAIIGFPTIFGKTRKFDLNDKVRKYNDVRDLTVKSNEQLIVDDNYISLNQSTYDDIKLYQISFSSKEVININIKYSVISNVDTGRCYFSYIFSPIDDWNSNLDNLKITIHLDYPTNYINTNFLYNKEQVGNKEFFSFELSEENIDEDFSFNFEPDIDNNLYSTSLSSLSQLYEINNQYLNDQNMEKFTELAYYIGSYDWDIEEITNLSIQDASYLTLAYLTKGFFYFNNIDYLENHLLLDSIYLPLSRALRIIDIFDNSQDRNEVTIFSNNMISDFNISYNNLLSIVIQVSARMYQESFLERPIDTEVSWLAALYVDLNQIYALDINLFNELLTLEEINFIENLDSTFFSEISKSKLEKDDLLSRYTFKIKQIVENSRYMIVNNSRVRIREAAGIQFQSLGYYNRGEKVQVLDKLDYTDPIQGMNDYWYKVKRSNGSIGWIYGYFLDSIE